MKVNFPQTILLVRCKNDRMQFLQTRKPVCALHSILAVKYNPIWRSMGDTERFVFRPRKIWIWIWRELGFCKNAIQLFAINFRTPLFFSFAIKSAMYFQKQLNHLNAFWRSIKCSNWINYKIIVPYVGSSLCCCREMHELDIPRSERFFYHTWVLYPVRLARIITS